MEQEVKTPEIKVRPGKKRILIIAVWIVFLVAANYVLFHAVDRIYHEKAQKELVEQANMIAGLIPEICENEYAYEAGTINMMSAKIETLLFGLQQYADLEEAEDFLTEYREAADLEMLRIYDREGELVFSADDEAEEVPDPDDFAADDMTEGMAPDDYTAADDLTKASTSEDSISLIVEDEELLNMILDLADSGITGVEAGTYQEENLSLIVKGILFAEEENEYVFPLNDQLLLVIKNNDSEPRAELRSFFGWKSGFSNVVVGQSGSLFVVDEDDGTILYWKDESLIETPLEEQQLTLEDLPAANQRSQIKEISLEGETYYAIRPDLKAEGVAIIAMMPFDEIAVDVRSASVMLMVLLILITGICVLYVFLHANDTPELVENSRHFIWDKGLSRKLKLLLLLALIAVFGIGMCLEALLNYAETFRYSQDKIDFIAGRYGANGFVREELEDWLGDEYLTKCEMAECVIDHTGDESITAEYLEDLAACLGVKTVYLFDRYGHVDVTNSDYDRVTIGKSSFFYPLLEGRPYLIGNVEKDELSGEILQKVGISMRDEDNKSDGCLLLTVGPEDMEVIDRNLGFRSIIGQAGLTEDTIFFAVRNSDLMADYVAFIGENMIMDVDYDQDDESMPSALEIGIDESVFTNEMYSDLNNNMFVVQHKYFAAIRNVDDHHLLVMKPQVGISRRNVLPVIFTTCAALIFLLILYVVSCVGTKSTYTRLRSAERAAQRAEVRAVKKAAKKEAAAHRTKLLNEDLFREFSKFLNRNKPSFEDRWPKDSKKWKDKTPDEKFSVLIRYIFFVVMVLVFIYAAIVGERSFLYYCLHGQRENGINFYSVISCLVVIGLLIVVKIGVHKLLYLTARAVGAKGETVCSLMDSFSSYLLFFAGVFLCLYLLGVQVRTLSLTGGVAGVVFGIGCQTIVADILTGILMTFEGTVRVGDRVRYNDKTGVVQCIGIRTTKLRFFNEDTIVRNSDFKNYVNMPQDYEARRTSQIRIGLNESLEHVEQIIYQELPEIQRRLSDNTDGQVSGLEYLGVESIGENCLVLLFAVYCPGNKAYITQLNLNRELKLMCERNHIRLAMPQVVVHEARDDGADAGEDSAGSEPLEK